MFDSQKFSCLREKHVTFYAPNFEEVEGAYWFGPVCPSVGLSVTHGYGQEPLDIGSWNGKYMYQAWKIRGALIFVFSVGLLVAEVCPSAFSTYAIITYGSLWTKYLGNHLSEDLDIRHADCIQCVDDLINVCQNYKYLAELCPLSDFGIFYCKATLWYKYLENRLS